MTPKERAILLEALRYIYRAPISEDYPSSEPLLDEMVKILKRKRKPKK